MNTTPNDPGCEHPRAVVDRDLTAPFGECGISGIGREGGDYALDFNSDLITFQVLDGSATPNGKPR